MDEPTIEDLVKFIRTSSSPLAALAAIASAFPEGRRAAIVLELQSLCSDLILADAVSIHRRLTDESR
jgi:hypothetical protein